MTDGCGTAERERDTAEKEREVGRKEREEGRRVLDTIPSMHTDS